MSFDDFSNYYRSFRILYFYCIYFYFFDRSYSYSLMNLALSYYFFSYFKT